MAEILEVLPDFPGFAVQYDTSKKPFFRPTVVETLRKLKEVAAGKALLSAIAAATPAVRGNFPASINVICVPTSIEFTQSGYKRDGFYGDGGVYTPTGMSCVGWVAALWQPNKTYDTCNYYDGFRLSPTKRDGVFTPSQCFGHYART